MPRYFFIMVSGQHQVMDPDGQELPSLDAAVEVADLSLCEIAGEALRAGAYIKLEMIVIADETGLELARVTTERSILSRFKALSKFMQ